MGAQRSSPVRPPKDRFAPFCDVTPSKTGGQPGQTACCPAGANDNEMVLTLDHFTPFDASGADWRFLSPDELVAALTNDPDAWGLKRQRGRPAKTVGAPKSPYRKTGVGGGAPQSQGVGATSKGGHRKPVGGRSWRRRVLGASGRRRARQRPALRRRRRTVEASRQLQPVHHPSEQPTGEVVAGWDRRNRSTPSAEHRPGGRGGMLPQTSGASVLDTTHPVAGRREVRRDASN